MSRPWTHVPENRIRLRIAHMDLISETAKINGQHPAVHIHQNEKEIQEIWKGRGGAVGIHRCCWCWTNAYRDHDSDGFRPEILSSWRPRQHEPPSPPPLSPQPAPPPSTPPLFSTEKGARAGVAKPRAARGRWRRS
jgi:hypothetical protein